MRFLVRVVFFLMLVGVLCGCATASVLYIPSSNTYRLTAEPAYNLTLLEDSINNQSLMSHDGNIWRLNCSIALYDGSILYANNSECSELIFDSHRCVYAFNRGKLYADGVTITSYNYSIGRAPLITEPQPSIELDTPILNNISLKNIGKVCVFNGLGADAENLSINECKNIGFVFYGLDNISVHNVSVENAGVGGVYLLGCKNSDIGYIHVNHAGSWHNPATGSFAIEINKDMHGAYCDNLTIHDAWVNDTGWGGIDETSYNLTLKNITISNSGHNGLDLHGGYGHYVENLTVRTTQNSGNNVYITAKDTYLKNLYLYNSTGDQINVANSAQIGYSNNNTLENVYMEYGGRGIVAFDSSNITCINCTHISSGKSLVLTKYNYPVTHSAIIDANFTGWVYIYNAIDANFLNTVYTYVSYMFPDNTRRLNEYYYLDVLTVNSTGSPVTDTELSVTNNIDSNISVKNALSKNTSMFETANGRTYLPSQNRTLSPAIAAINKSVVSYPQIHTLDISTPIGNISLDNVQADSTWYRINPDQSKYTITAIINDSTNTHLTGFAPLVSENNYFEGDQVKFQIWTSEPVDSIKWKEGKSVIAENTTILRRTLTAEPITVDLFVDDNNGSFSKTWTIIPTNLPTPSFSANITTGDYPLFVSFIDESENTATSWEWDFDGDGRVDSTTRNPVVKYKAKGTYTVSLTTGNSTGKLTETKTAYITVTKQSYIRKLLMFIR